jgi:histidinol phosphatase-like enzyme (inositol monophosphatase family)
MRISDMSDNPHADFLVELAAAAARETLPRFRQTLDIEDKQLRGVFDPVTIADRSAEEAMRALINARYPEHGILGEEFGAERTDAEHVWVLDPVDGTRAFISGLPVWGTLAGLTRNGRAVLGLMAQPFTGELFCGDGARAWYTGPGGARVLKTRANGDLSSATLMTTTPALFKGAEAEAYGRVERAVRMPRYGADCYAYCMVASGHIDLVIETGLAPYDIVALIPIIEGAGGIVTNWEGEPAEAGGRVIAAGDRRLHAAALALLNS